MDARILSPILLPQPSLHPHDPNPFFKPRAPPPRTVAFRPASVSSGGPTPTGDDGATNSAAPDGGGGKAISPANNNSSGEAAAKASAQPLNIRYRSISRKQARQQQRGSGGGGAAPPPPVAAPPKVWEEMTVGEKAVELYMGEKGLLFWLNKLAYASIFAVVGGWILFRFVGPSLGLYQLDTPPLAPSAMFKG